MLDFRIAKVYKNDYGVGDFGDEYTMPFQAYL